ncbi:hypothetical protein [Chryseobacterium sp. HMWF035]|nr:hypothetical protein [Chryseobacterium sp. HMWF035]
MANFQELFPAFRTRYFVYLGFAALPPQTPNTQNELKQSFNQG